MDNNKEKMPPKEASSSGEIVEKLAQELDKKVVISPPADLHPLLIDLVVQKIMAFFSVKDLKSARLVSKLWRVEGGRQILSKSHLCPKFNNNSDELTEEELLNFLSLVKPSAMFKLFCGNQDILNIIQKFPKLAERVTELKYETNAPNEVHKLVKASQKLPYLRILDTNDLSLQHVPIYQGTWNRSLIARNLEVNQFYKQLESLEEIRLDYPINFKNNPILVELGSGLKNVSKIILDKPEVETVNFLISENVEWPLNHVTLKFGENPRDVNQGSIRNFFIKNGNTLKFLDIEMLINLTAQEPWEDNWLIPLDFPVLETMIISGSEDNIWSLLTIALRLPQLKKLVLSRVPDFVCTKIQEWENYPLANGKKLQSLSIEQVVLNCSVSSSSSVMLKGSLWPNLKSLQVNINKGTLLYNSRSVNPHLFSYWQGLERLELNIPLAQPFVKQFHPKWLIGADARTIRRHLALGFKTPAISSSYPASKLRDLNKLKCLTVRVSRKFSLDKLIYDSLQFMTNLQALHFNAKSEVSIKALGDLKKALGDIVSFVDEEYEGNSSEAAKHRMWQLY